MVQQQPPLFHTSQFFREDLSASLTPKPSAQLGGSQSHPLAGVLFLKDYPEEPAGQTIRPVFKKYNYYVSKNRTKTNLEALRNRDGHNANEQQRGAVWSMNDAAFSFLERWKVTILTLRAAHPLTAAGSPLSTSLKPQ